jgi:stearoyl-CoA desaturase (delta-9 desaturase)
VEWGRFVPFIALHAACLLVFVVGVSWIAIGVALGLYVIRMFAITAFYHRYFSHRAFKTSRAFQFLMACVGCCAVQRGPLWWAAHHRHHHRVSDQPGDVHSPKQVGFWWSHMGWFVARENYLTRHELVRDLGRYPELRFIDRFDILPPIALGVVLWFVGDALSATHPEVSGWQLVIWGCVVSTIGLAHATYTINSLAHRWGRRRFATSDDSRNNFWLALLTFGEGWHNNHHHYAASARQGFFWWEIDLSYYVLKLMSWLRIVWDLRPVPARVRVPTAQGKAP